MRRLAADADNHDFALDLAHGRLLFVRGAYPRKSYLCAQPLSKGGARCFRVEGFSLEGGVYPLKDGRAAFVEGRHYADELYAEKGESLPRHALLRVDLEEERAVRTYRLAESAKVLAIVEPRWDKEPVVALRNGDAAGLARAGADTDLKLVPLKLGLGRAGALAIAEDYPSAAAADWGMSGATLRFFDAATGALGKDLGLDSPGLIRALGGNRWLVTVQDAKTGRDTVMELDQSRGRAAALLACDGAVTSVAENPRWLYAVCQSSHGTFDPKRKWLHPQELRRADLEHPGPVWSIPWTQHPGELLGLDADGGRLYYAVTDQDQAGVWAVDATPAALAPAALARAAAAIDRGSPLTEGLAAGIATAALLAAFVIGTVWLLLEGPR